MKLAAAVDARELVEARAVNCKMLISGYMVGEGECDNFEIAKKLVRNALGRDQSKV